MQANIFKHLLSKLLSRDSDSAPKSSKYEIIAKIAPRIAEAIRGKCHEAKIMYLVRGDHYHLAWWHWNWPNLDENALIADGKAVWEYCEKVGLQPKLRKEVKTVRGAKPRYLIAVPVANLKRELDQGLGLPKVRW
jgi:hypothetical protein